MDNIKIVNPTDVVKEIVEANFLGRLVSTALAYYPDTLDNYYPIHLVVNGKCVDLRDMLETILVKVGDNEPELLVDVFYGDHPRTLGRHELRVRLYRSSINLVPYDVVIA